MSREQAAGGLAVAAATAAVVGFFMAAVLPRATWPLIDGDVWWHIRAGEEILRTGAVPRQDSWSIVALGREWTSQDWLANVLLAAGNSLGEWGRTGLSFLFGALTVLAFWILWRAIALREPTIGWASRIIWLSAGLALAGPVMGVRVQVLDLLLATVVVWACWRYLMHPRRLWLAVLPLVTVLWANVHAGWVLLFLIGGAMVVGEAVDRLLSRQLHGRPPLSWPQIRDLFLALLVSAAALVINPNGIDLYGYPFYTLGITALNRYVMEWFPASLDTLFGQLLAAFVVLGVVPALIFGRRRLRMADALLLIGLTLMAYRAIRFLLILGPIGAAIVAVVLSPVIAQTRFGQRFGATLARRARPRGGAPGLINAFLVVLLVALGVGIALFRVSPAAQASEISRVLPSGAVAWMEQHDPGHRIFNRYEWGGYIGQHRPDQPIFMDGRADVYGNDLLRMYVGVIGLEGDPQQTFDRYDIDYVVYPPDLGLSRWLNASPEWQRVYEDETAAIWVRRSA